MIRLGDIYKVVEAMVPLYFALVLGYGSIRWWRIFSPAECDTINRLVAYFAFPFFAFRFTLNTDPYDWNYRAIAGDVIAKVIVIGSLAAWSKYSEKGSYAWSITSFSLTTLTNALVMGVPLLTAMYGDWAGDLVVQLAVFQAVTWLTLLLFVLELRKALEEMRRGCTVTPVEITLHEVTSGHQENINEGKEPGINTDNTSNNTHEVAATNDLESGNSAWAVRRRFSVWSVMKVVGLKLALNPNSYASLVGITWALVARRYIYIMHDSKMKCRKKLIFKNYYIYIIN